MATKSPESPDAKDPLSREQIRLLRMYADSLPQPIFEVGPDLRLRFANAAALEAFGYTAGELGEGLFVLDLLEPDERETGAERVRRMFGGEPLAPREYVARRKDGSTFQALIRSRAIFENGVLVGLRGTVEDVTERRRALEALEARAKRQQAAAHLAEIALETSDVDALLAEVTVRVAATLGVEFVKILEYRPLSNDFLLRAGVGWRDGLVGLATAPGGIESQAGFTLVSEVPIIVTDVAREARFEVPDLLTEHGVRSGLGVTITRDGHPWGVLSAHATRPREFTGDEADFVVAVASLVASAVARLALEEQLILSQKMEAVGRLTGGVVHDFNNILTTISGCADLLLMDDNPQNARHYGSEIRDAAQRAVALTQQLQSVSRRQVVRSRVLDIRTVFDGLAGTLDRLIGEDVTMTIAAARHVGWVRADPGQIEQIILSLVVNARDAMRSGGRLSITLDNVDAAEVRDLPRGLFGPLVRFTVVDSGVGMDEETRRRIFEPFFTTKEKGRGTGLGLSTTYGIVQQAGGHITVTSQPRRGSRFTVYLPRLAESPLTAGVQPSTAGLRASGVTVLLVEDDDEVRRIARPLLAGDGRTVLEAISLEEAMGVARRHPGPIDLLITDVIMPEGSGPQLATALRRDRPDLRVLYMSGYTEETLAPHNVLDPGSGLIQKPFDVAQLELAVQNVLGTPPPSG